MKLTAPYWFHFISYKTRLLMASLAMGIACFLVGCGGLFRDEEGGEEYSGQPKDAESQNFGLVLELVGVSFVSFSCNLGEASLLSLAGKFDSIILPKMASSSGSYWEISEEQTEDCPEYKYKSQRNDNNEVMEWPNHKRIQ